MNKKATLLLFVLGLASSLWMLSAAGLAGQSAVVAALPPSTPHSGSNTLFDRTVAVAAAGSQAEMYTVVFQTGISPAGYNGTADAIMDYFATTTNYGTHTEVWTKSDGWQRSVIRFDLTQHIPSGVQVVSASLTLRVLGQSAALATRLAVYPIVQPWVESQVTWNQAQQAVEWWGGGGCEGASRASTATTHADFSFSSGDVVLDVTTAVQAWLDDPASNQGLLLNGEFLAGGVKYRYASSNYPSPSLRPKLVVGYEGAPPLATPTPTSTPTRTPTPSVYTVITSTLGDWKTWNTDDCMKVNDVVRVSRDERMILIYRGTPWMAKLYVTICNSDKPHPIYFNGTLIGTAPTFSTGNCECNVPPLGGYKTSFDVPLSLLAGGPGFANYISTTNSYYPYDSFKVYNAHLVLTGDITGTSRSHFAIGTDADDSPLFGAIEVPLDYDPALATPLLIVVPGTGEDRLDGLNSYASRAHEMGWLLASLDIRKVYRTSEKFMRSPSLAVQDNVMSLLRYVQDNFSVDRSRIYIMGFSTGGGIAATVAAKYPDVFAGVLDYAGPNDYGDWYAERADINIELQAEFGGDPTGNFEYPRRSSRYMARNLRYVPMRIVHGTADTRVPFRQSSRLFYEAMPVFYSPVDTFKQLHQHAGGHEDYVAGISETDLPFLAEHTLSENPSELNIITDEGKSYYWLDIQKLGVSPRSWQGWVEVDARFDPVTSTIWVTAKDGGFAEGRPLSVTLDLARMGLNTAIAYDVEESDLQTGEFLFHPAVLPLGGNLVLTAGRNSQGSVGRQFVIYPASGRTLYTLSLHADQDGYQGATDSFVSAFASDGPEVPHSTSTRLLFSYDQRRKALLRFDVSSVPAGMVLKAARLTVNLLETRTNVQLSVYEALRPWVDTEVTWQKASTSVSWSVSGGDGIGTDRVAASTYSLNNVGTAGPYTFNVKPLAERWITDPGANLGVFLIGSGTYSSDSYALASAENADADKRPLLDVLYMAPFVPPAITPTATRTPTPTYTPTGTSTNTPTPTATLPGSTPDTTATASPTAAATHTSTPTPTVPFNPTVISSTVSGCMEIVADGVTVQSAESRMLLLWEGTPTTARLVLTSCGVGPDRHHSIYLNGQHAARVETDVYSTCICGSNGLAVTYTLSSPSMVINGWNTISITNDSGLQDTWTGHSARLIIEGNIRGYPIGEITYVSSWDNTTRHALYQLPINHDPANPIPVLVSVGGVGETKWDGIFRFSERANARGWLLVAPDIRWGNELGVPNLDWGVEKGRTASPAVQHDIISAVDYVLAHSEFGGDPNRVYLSGFSVGGGIVATVAEKYPHRIAAVANWAGPTDLNEWAQQREALGDSGVSAALIRDIGCPYAGPGMCPIEWIRRSARSMTQNIQHVPMVIVHGRNDTRVPFAQSADYVEYMEALFDAPEHKLFVWHDGEHVDELPDFEGLDFLGQFTLNPRPTDIRIRADESKDYYWIRLRQRDWNGNWADGFSTIDARYDLTSRVISATIADGRAFREGNLPIDISFDLRGMGLDPLATYTIEDYNTATGDFALLTITPTDGLITVSLPRDRLNKVSHQYLIYPYAAQVQMLTYQQGVGPTTGYAGCMDTHLYLYDPNSNFASLGAFKINSGATLVSLLKFDLSGLPSGALIKSAQLELYLNSTQTTPLELSLFALRRHWVDVETTWYRATLGDMWSTEGAAGAGTDYDPVRVSSASVMTMGPYVLNVRPLVQSWTSGEVANEGFLISGPRMGGSGSLHYHFASADGYDLSRRPKLHVVYALPTPTPTPTLTPTVTRTPTPSQVPSATPTVTATPPACTLVGSVALQRPGRPAPDPSWSVLLTVTIGGQRYVVSTDTSGNFELAGLTPGTYDIHVKGTHTLANLRSSVTLLPGSNTAAFGTLREGDSNDDNCVAITDFSILASAFSPQYDPRADFNMDGYVSILDFSMLRENFGLCGDLIVPAP
jgi:dienelactone hydrolase